MGRIHLMLTAPQRSWLEKQAQRMGITISELIRRIIDEARTAK